MVVPVYVALLFFWVAEDVVGSDEVFKDVLTVGLGDSFMLNCTYNCAAQFIRGCWKEEKGNPHCHTGQNNTNGVCTVSLHLLNVTETDAKGTYKCYTEQTDDPQLQQEIQRIVFLQLQNATCLFNLSNVGKILTTAALPDGPNNSTEDHFGKLTGALVLAWVSVFVATVLAALAVYLCVKQHRQIWNDKGGNAGAGSRRSSPPPATANTVPLSIKGTPSVQSERVTLKIPPSDDNSNIDVPYAEILITVRGVSTPELTQVNYRKCGDQQSWGDDSRCNLQASRSADRLHIPRPREVRRKMSTSSEYAVITYA